MTIETGTPIEDLLDPECQCQLAIANLRLVTKFFGPKVAQKQTKGLDLSPEDVEAAISAGVKEAKENK